MTIPFENPDLRVAARRIANLTRQACLPGLLGVAMLAGATPASNASRWTSPDGRKVVFFRTNVQAIDRGVGAPSGGRPEVDLWISRADGSDAHLLLAGTGTQAPETNLTDIEQIEFSPDGRTLYFQTYAWLTSPAIHAVDIASGKQRLVTHGWLNHVVPAGRFKGDLVVHQHRHFVGSGTYEWYWLFTGNGKEVGPIGPTEADPGTAARGLKDFEEDDEH